MSNDAPLDLDLVRAQFPAFDNEGGNTFFENAAGSFACRQTIDALTRYYTETKVQPYSAYAASAAAGAAGGPLAGRGLPTDDGGAEPYCLHAGLRQLLQTMLHLLLRVVAPWSMST